MDLKEADKKSPILYPEVNDSQYVGRVLLDEKTNDLILETRDGKKITIETLEDFKKIKTKFLLKR